MAIQDSATKWQGVALNSSNIPNPFAAGQKGGGYGRVMLCQDGSGVQRREPVIDQQPGRAPASLPVI